MLIDPIDILIQSTNDDLNVYIDTLPDGTTRDRCPKDGQEASASACSAPETKVVCGCATEKQASACCGFKGDECVSCRPMAQSANASAELGDVDLNEWVGKCLQSPCFPGSVTHLLLGSYKVFAVKAQRM
jgi:arsenite methyltransferase